jgi:hypothetical protein
LVKIVDLKNFWTFLDLTWWQEWPVLKGCTGNVPITGTVLYSTSPLPCNVPITGTVLYSTSPLPGAW